jgi:hypothetical protein
MSNATPENIRGARAIAEFIGMPSNTKTIFYHLDKGAIPGARKIGGRYVLHVPTYRAAFNETLPAPPVAA